MLRSSYWIGIIFVLLAFLHNGVEGKSKPLPYVSKSYDLNSYIEHLSESKRDLEEFITMLCQDPQNLQLFITQLIPNEMAFKSFVSILSQDPKSLRYFDQTLKEAPLVNNLFLAALELSGDLKKEYLKFQKKEPELACGGNPYYQVEPTYRPPNYQSHYEPVCAPRCEPVQTASCISREWCFKFLMKGLFIASLGYAGAWSWNQFNHKKTTQNYRRG